VREHGEEWRSAATEAVPGRSESAVARQWTKLKEDAGCLYLQGDAVVVHESVAAEQVVASLEAQMPEEWSDGGGREGAQPLKRRRMRVEPESSSEDDFIVPTLRKLRRGEHGFESRRQSEEEEEEEEEGEAESDEEQGDEESEEDGSHGSEGRGPRQLVVHRQPRTPGSRRSRYPVSPGHPSPVAPLGCARCGTQSAVGKVKPKLQHVQRNAGNLVLCLQCSLEREEREERDGLVPGRRNAQPMAQRSNSADTASPSGVSRSRPPRQPAGEGAPPPAPHPARASSALRAATTHSGSALSDQEDDAAGGRALRELALVARHRSCGGEPGHRAASDGGAAPEETQLVPCRYAAPTQTIEVPPPSEFGLTTPELRGATLEEREKCWQWLIQLSAKVMEKPEWLQLLGRSEGPDGPAWPPMMFAWLTACDSLVPPAPGRGLPAPDAASLRAIVLGISRALRNSAAA